MAVTQVGMKSTGFEPVLTLSLTHHGNLSRALVFLSLSFQICVVCLTALFTSETTVRTCCVLCLAQGRRGEPAFSECFSLRTLSLRSVFAEQRGLPQ